jgi:phosphoribosyl 1,2-cyclic phosphate phosphodiesterase
MLDQFEQASILVLGSGTSIGIPMIGCHCKTCRSSDPRDQRLRPSVLIKLDQRRVLIDTGPDFRTQALRHGIERIDAVLYTHSHADHILGLDDLRPFNYMQSSDIPIYGSAHTLDVIEHTFEYVFNGKPTQSSRPKLTSIRCSDGERFNIAGLEFEPVKAFHGKLEVFGFRFADCAYLTDHSSIPDQSKERLRDLDVLFLDALRYNAHPTHQTIQQSLQMVEELNPKRAFFTHISHDVLHASAEARLPENVRLAYDGLEIPIGRAGLGTAQASGAVVRSPD